MTSLEHFKCSNQEYKIDSPKSNKTHNKLRSSLIATIIIFDMISNEHYHHNQDQLSLVVRDDDHDDNVGLLGGSVATIIITIITSCPWWSVVANWPRLLLKGVGFV